MDYELILLPLAQKEIGEAVEYYESRQAGLGMDFITYLNVIL